MYKRISGLKFWLIGVITGGIYPLCMWGRMTRNMNSMARKVGEETIMGFLGVLLLTPITLGIVPLVWTIKFFGRAARLNQKASAGISPSNGFVMFLLSLVPIFSFFWLADMNNKLADAYEKIR